MCLLLIGYFTFQFFILIILFESSSNLASAYGVAVTMTMLCVTILISVLAYGAWKWPWWKVAMFAIPFLALDGIFVASTSLKILAGGWVPIVIGIVVFTILMTWKRGREIVYHRLETDALPMSLFIRVLVRVMKRILCQAKRYS